MKQNRRPQYYRSSDFIYVHAYSVASWTSREDEKLELPSRFESCLLTTDLGIIAVAVGINLLLHSI